jgi:hypothetical protein
MSRRAQIRAYEANRDRDRSGSGMHQLPGDQMALFNLNPNHRTLSNPPPSSNIPPRFHKKQFDIPLPSTTRKTRPLPMDPTKADPETRKTIPVAKYRQYKVGTSTANVEVNANYWMGSLKPPSSDPFQSTSGVQQVSPKARQCLKVYHPNANLAQRNAVDVPVTEIQDNCTTTTLSNYCLNNTTTDMGDARQETTDCWPTVQQTNRPLQDGLLHSSDNVGTNANHFQGVLNRDMLTGGYGKDTFHGVGGSRRIVSTNPIPAHQEDYLWPDSSIGCKNVLNRAGGGSCLFDFSATHLKGFRSQESTSVANKFVPTPESSTTPQSYSQESVAEPIKIKRGGGRHHVGRKPNRYGYVPPEGNIQVKDHASNKQVKALRGKQRNYQYENTHQRYNKKSSSTTGTGNTGTTNRLRRGGGQRRKK